jgi:hypothetical protein
VSMAFFSLSKIILVKTLLGMDNSMIPRQLLHKAYCNRIPKISQSLSADQHADLQKELQKHVTPQLK